jgi:membrane protease YdiL (CAAX protease family)
VGFLVGITGTLIVVGFLAVLVGAEPNDESSTFVILGTLAQGAVFAATALFFASRVAKPKPWHFGLRPTRLRPAVGWAALGILAFYVTTAIYSAIVKPDAEQGTVEALGGDQGTFGLIAAGVMVIAVAPAVEEFFFRGFFYRALRSRFTVIAAALIDGALFGLIHFDNVDGLVLLPPLGLLGFIFCLVYERTGSLFPVIAMHAFNNTLAFAIQADNGWRVSVVVGPLVLLGCVLVPRLLPPGPRAAPV